MCPDSFVALPVSQYPLNQWVLGNSEGIQLTAEAKLYAVMWLTGSNQQCGPYNCFYLKKFNMMRSHVNFKRHKCYMLFWCRMQMEDCLGLSSKRTDWKEKCRRVAVRADICLMNLML